MPKLTGKVAVITGGSTGIGLATAQLFANEGAHVYITGRHQKELDEAVASIGKNATGVQGDVAKLADLDRLYATVKQQHGYIDIVFANAGVSNFISLDTINEEDFNNIFNVNVKGVLFTVQKALPLMKDGGSVIITGSIAGVQGQTTTCLYSATKAAIRSFARTWTSELLPRNIRVNVVSPGPIKTPLTDALSADEGGKKTMENLISTIPMGRMGDPSEVANAVLFLASNDSSFITGIDLFVDGGTTQV